MRAKRSKKTTNSRINKIRKTRQRNIAIVILIAFCLFIIYKINFLTKSEETEKLTSVKFTEYETNNELNDDIVMYEDENGTYIILPEKVKGIYAQKFYLLNTTSETEDTNTTVETNADVVENVVEEMQNTIENTSVNSTVTNDATNSTTNSLISKVVQGSQKNFLTSSSANEVSSSESESTSQEDETTSQEESSNTSVNSDTTTNEDTSKDTTESTTSENTVTDKNDTSENKVSNTISNTVSNTTSTNTTSTTNTTPSTKVENVVTNEVSDETSYVTEQSEENTDVDIDGMTSYSPGEKVYIDEKVLDKDKAEFVVIYQTVEINDLKLYKQELQAEDNSINIKVTGYIPLNYSLNVTPQDDDTINELREDVDEFEESDILFAYDIKIMNGENEYQPKDYYQVVNVEFSSEEKFTGKLISAPVQIVHIAESTEQIDFQKITLSEKTEDTLVFPANEFSKYVAFTETSVETDKVNIYDYESDYNYYMGKNYTDNNSGEYQGLYTDSNLTKVTINYYGYNYDKDITDTTKTFNPTSKWSVKSTATSNGIYTYTVNITATTGTTQVIDNNNTMTMTFTLPSSVKQTVNSTTVDIFDLSTTSNDNSDLTISYDSDSRLVTVTGTNWDKWTKNSVISYALDLKLSFSSSIDISSVSDLSVTAVEKYLVGYVSADESERQCLFSYVKCVPITSGNISIELIDNPYMDRPAGFGFDGWTSNNTNYVTAISTNSSTKVQTLTISTDSCEKGSDGIVINLYANWAVANIVFVDTDNGSSTNTGLNISSPVNSWSTANNILTNSSNYKTATNASNRELNIVVFINGELTSGETSSSGWNQTTYDLETITKAYTLTSLYDGQDYRTTGGNNKGYSATLYYSSNVTLSHDLQLDFLKFICGGTYNQYNEGTGNINYCLYVNTYNLRIGRGMIVDSDNQETFAQVQGGPNGTTNSEYRFVIESGKYQNLQVGRANSSGSYTAFATFVAGNDFDRVSENNTNLKVYYRTASRTAGVSVYSYNSNPLYIMNIKSGSFGMDYFSKDTTNSNAAYSGIYLGGHGSWYAYDYGDRTLIVEGGNIANIIGGLATPSGTTVKTNIYVKGGTIQNIVGGAGVSQAYGDRMIQVTDGTVAYSVSGGSNGRYASGGNDTGVLDGNTLIYIGGNAVIGKEENSDSTLYKVDAGCVLGAGNGNEQYAASVNSSHIIVDGNAKISNNVYGGGNYGTVGTDNSGSSGSSDPVVEFSNESSNIVEGEKYLITNGTTSGSSNQLISSNNQVSSQTLSNTSIPSDTEQWILEASGNGYKIKNASTGMYLMYNVHTGRDGVVQSVSTALTSDSSSATVFYKQNNSDSVYLYCSITVKKKMGNRTYTTTQNYYLYSERNGGWSFSEISSQIYFLKYTKIQQSGDVEEIANETLTVIDIYGGTIGNDVYGGANKNSIYGSVDINMYNGTINGTMYGGSNDEGTINGVTDIAIEGGTIGNSSNSSADVVFGGGKGKDTIVSQYSKINITDNSTSKVDNSKCNVYLYGSIYGGSALGTISGNSYVTVQDIYSDSKTITINGNIYGGGKGGTDETSKTSISATTGGNTTVIVDGGTYSSTQVFGGCNVNGTIGGVVTVKIGETSATKVNQVYGGGNEAAITTSTQGVYVYLYVYATVDDAFNGGNSAGIDGDNDATPRLINVQGSTVTNVYGGSNSSGTLTETHVNIEAGYIGETVKGATVTNVYGGGYGSSTVISGNTDVDIKLSTVENVYGGGNAGIVQGNTDVYIASSTVKAFIDGDASAVYGGGQSAEVTGKTNVNIESSTVSDVYGGGEDGTVKDTSENATTVLINSSIANNVYGGGKGSAATVSGTTNVTIESKVNVTSTINNCVYGGGDAGAVEGSTIVKIYSAEITGSVYGGGKGETAIVSGSTTTTIEGSTINDCVYGGGDAGAVEGSTIVTISDSQINKSDSVTTSGNVYGGGNQADVTGATSVDLTDSSAYAVYGGGNQGKVGSTTTVSIIRTNIEDCVYGGGNKGAVLGNTTVTVSNQEATDTTNLPEVKGSVFGGGKAANVNGTTVNIQSNAIVQNVYGGGDQGEVTEDTTVKIIDSTIVNAVYGGGNGADSTTSETSPGKVGGNTNVVISASDSNIANATYTTAQYVFGGGKGKTAYVGGDTDVVLKKGTKIGTITTTTDSEENETTTTTSGGDVYGGGDNGYVAGSTTVELKSPIVAGSVYAAGNGSNAVVDTNSYVYTEGTTYIYGNLFGGGNAAATGLESVQTSTAIVDIAGGTIAGNVFGAANSSKVYGDTIINIGNAAIDTYYTNLSNSSTSSDTETDADTDEDTNGTTTSKSRGYEKGSINIAGTIYGGGYSMSADPTKWDESAYSVTKDITINVYGDDYDIVNSDGTISYPLDIGGSIFGSGNASNANKDGNVYIKNYGTESNRKNLVSIQRSTTTNIYNSVLVMSGVKDSTSNYDEAAFVFSNIGELQLQNNTTLYLKNGANVLKSFSSLDKNGEKATVVISDNKIETRDTDTGNDNRIYMLDGVNLNIYETNPQDEPNAGPVTGMTFFGLFKLDDDGNIYKGIYDQSYGNENVGNSIESYYSRKFVRTYVYGKHVTSPEQDITVDGFYTNMEALAEGLDYENLTEENYEATFYISYIDTTPKDHPAWYWYTGPGEETYSYDIELIASKFSTMGSCENPFSNISFPDATLTLTEVDSTQLLRQDGSIVELIDKNQIDTINTSDDSNIKLALEMKSGNTGWSTKGTTDFYKTSDGVDSYDGDTTYQFENASTTPSMNFILYHSNNITGNEDLGTYRIIMNLSYWKSDGLNRGTAKVIFNVKIYVRQYDGVGYSVAISPGMQYDLFATSSTNITTESSFSTYFEMGEESFFDSLDEVIKNNNGGANVPDSYLVRDTTTGMPTYYIKSYREISTGYVFPANTTITMIDRYDSNNPEYYYYIVTSEDETNKKTVFKLSEFLAMGSIDKYYNESVMRQKYYLSDYSDGKGYQYENFIFIVNFEGADFSSATTDDEGKITDSPLFNMYLKFDYTDSSNTSATYTLADIINDQKKVPVYNIYKLTSTIGVEASLSKTKIYLGNDVDINVTTTYNAKTTSSVTVSDTRYFDKKLGIKLTFYYKENGEYTKVNGGTILGTYFGLTKNGTTNYSYPRSDGTTRIKIAELVSNSSSAIDFITTKSTLPTGEYKILVEVFGSADGTYYGVEADASTEVEMQIINDIYGLKSTLAEDRQAIIDATTGQVEDSEGYVQEEPTTIENTSTDENGNTVTTETYQYDNKIKFNLEYQSGLSNPYITVSLYRRDYDSADSENPNLYQRTYTLVDLADYVQNTLIVPTKSLSDEYTDEQEEYINSVIPLTNEYEAESTEKIDTKVNDNTVSVTFDDLEYTLKQNLKTGTYKVVFTLYDTTDTTITRNITDDEGTITQETYNVREYEKIGDAFTYIIIK